MAVKDEILKIFEEGRGAYYSGEELAARLGVSRNAVWKAVKQLETDGYKFNAVSGRGYCMDEQCDVLSEQGIKSQLGSLADSLDLHVYKTISSTNTVLKEMAANGAVEGTILVSSEQTAGRGRMNRKFYSPQGTGLYLSILIRPRMSASESLFITTAAAVAVARAIEEISGRATGIKWVNDVFMDGKKVCGILTEGSLDMESGGLEYAVLGIGINIAPPKGGFPDEIKDIAGAVFEGSTPCINSKNRIAAAVINYFMEYYKNLGQHSFLDEYIKRSIIVGKEIMVLGAAQPRKAKALSIDSECRLHVMYESGEQAVLSSGEVSIRCV